RCTGLNGLPGDVDGLTFGYNPVDGGGTASLTRNRGTRGPVAASFSCYKAMSDTPGNVQANDFPFGVNSVGLRIGRTRGIDGGEGALVEQEAVEGAAGLIVKADYIARRADTCCEGFFGARDIERREHALLQQEATMVERRGRGRVRDVKADDITF